MERNSFKDRADTANVGGVDTRTAPSCPVCGGKAVYKHMKKKLGRKPEIGCRCLNEQCFLHHMTVSLDTWNTARGGYVEVEGEN